MVKGTPEVRSLSSPRRLYLRGDRAVGQHGGIAGQKDMEQRERQREMERKREREREGETE